MKHLCGCPDFGEYTGTVELVPPEFLKRDDGRGICIDVCLALEITNLWKQGIKTLNSCCGHGKIPASIIVDATSEKAMEDLGYVIDKSNTVYTHIYLAKTKLNHGKPVSAWRWIYRNDEPAHNAEAHAYMGDNDVSACGKANRSKFDWTEMDGERCIECQNLVKETK